MILDIQGSAGIVQKRVPLERGVTAANSVKLKYFHLPKLPLLDVFVNAVTVNAVSHNILAASSVQAIVDQLDALTSGGARVVYCWYNQSEFEICTGAQAVTLSAAFAALFKLPTALVANTCYSSAIFESEVSVYSHYAIQVGHARGYYDGASYNQIIARVRRDGDISHAHSHYFNSAMTHFDMKVLAVKRDGTFTSYQSPEVWSIGFEISD